MLKVLTGVPQGPLTVKGLYGSICGGRGPEWVWEPLAQGPGLPGIKAPNTLGRSLKPRRTRSLIFRDGLAMDQGVTKQGVYALAGPPPRLRGTSLTPISQTRLRGAHSQLAQH